MFTEVDGRSFGRKENKRLFTDSLLAVRKVDGSRRKVYQWQGKLTEGLPTALIIDGQLTIDDGSSSSCKES